MWVELALNSRTSRFFQENTQLLRLMLVLLLV